IYQYSLTMLRALHEWKEEGCEDEFVIFAAELLHPALVSLNGCHWTIKSLPVQLPSLRQQTLNVLRRIIGEELHRGALRWLHAVTQGSKATLPNLDVVN